MGTHVKNVGPWVVVNKLSKYVTFIAAPTNYIEEEMVRLFLKHVVKYWELPKHIIRNHVVEFNPILGRRYKGSSPYLGGLTRWLIKWNYLQGWKFIPSSMRVTWNSIMKTRMIQVKGYKEGAYGYHNLIQQGSWAYHCKPSHWETRLPLAT